MPVFERLVMKKSILLLSIVIVAFFFLAGCNSETIAVFPSLENVYDVSDGSKTINGTDTLDYGTWAPDSSNSALIPWQGNVKNLVKADGTLRFYFMAGEGTQVAGVGEKIGDCCLVFFPNGETMLIDACSDSGSPGYIPTLVDNIRRLGVSRLDYVVITHQHRDHYGGFTVTNGIADSFEVGKLYLNGLTKHNGYSTITKKAGNNAMHNSIPVEVMQEGDELTIGGVTIKILNPINGATLDDYDTSTRGTNDASLVMLITYGDVKALFTGDLYDSGMKAMVDRYGKGLNADILKIPHHGHSETSILDSFAFAVNPIIAIASSSIAMSDNVYKLYRQCGATVLCDYNEGYVVISTDGQKIYTKTSRIRQTDYYEVYDRYYQGLN